MKIDLAGEEFELRCAGTLYWPARGILITSDLHLEKGSSFLSRGFFLPPYDTHDTLERLETEIARTAPRKLILLGDSFHDEKGYARLARTDRDRLDNLLHGRETLWIHGNHEKGFVPAGIKSAESADIGAIRLRHEASTDGNPELGQGGAEISGHFHPVAALKHKGHKIKGRCFLLTGRRLILPSFGSYTGGLDIHSPDMRSRIGNDYIAHICLEKRVFAVHARHFEN